MRQFLAGHFALSMIGPGPEGVNEARGHQRGESYFTTVSYCIPHLFPKRYEAPGPRGVLTAGGLALSNDG